jgi:predicted anti-sigma-YlaC factor YlaD
MRLFRKPEFVTCSDAKQDLSAFIDHQLGPERQAAVQLHLSACPECREDLRSLEATVALLRQLPQAAPVRPVAVPATRPLRLRRAVASLGMATAAISLLLVLAFAADLANVFQTTQYPAGDSYSEIGGRSTSGSSPTDEPNQDQGTTPISTESDWVRPLEFSLLGASAVLGSATYVIWRRSRKPAAVPARR